MKKTYIIPEIEIYEVSHTNVIAQSFGFYDNDVVIGQGDYTDVEELGRENNNWGREQNNVWDQGW